MSALGSPNSVPRPSTPAADIQPLARNDEQVTLPPPGDPERVADGLDSTPEADGDEAEPDWDILDPQVERLTYTVHMARAAHQPRRRDEEPIRTLLPTDPACVRDVFDSRHVPPDNRDLFLGWWLTFEDTPAEHTMGLIAYACRLVAEAGDAGVQTGADYLREIIEFEVLYKAAMRPEFREALNGRLAVTPLFDEHVKSGYFDVGRTGEGTNALTDAEFFQFVVVDLFGLGAVVQQVRELGKSEQPDNKPLTYKELAQRTMSAVFNRTGEGPFLTRSMRLRLESAVPRILINLELYDGYLPMLRELHRRANRVEETIELLQRVSEGFPSDQFREIGVHALTDEQFAVLAIDPMALEFVREEVFAVLGSGDISSYWGAQMAIDSYESEHELGSGNPASS